MAYNVLMVPLAAGALYPVTRMQLPPALAGLAMALSSVSVVASSLLLRRYQRPPPVLRDRVIFGCDAYAEGIEAKGPEAADMAGKRAVPLGALDGVEAPRTLRPRA